MILLVDNQDSFTFNLFQAVETLGTRCLVVSAAEARPEVVRQLGPLGLILSPGPGNPDQAKESLVLAQTFGGQLPILGVCLGHQVLGVAFGAKWRAAKRLVYGKGEEIWHPGQGILAGLPQPFVAARYHSLALEAPPPGFVALAQTQDGELMAMAHRSWPVFGLQFHPESFLTPAGNQILKNFLSLCLHGA
ncbi:MAG: hypothetical protein A2600_05075 [Candidatus Lambdaproteobacteria bacterium RIFOXYD1_FULL_56_27]|uniref:Glutamine amidotransferase domain-containing protein n=1 Tax=Candidatus Lambdaproteobacteria bacterium RIFOXYD2_FULL_56_26 TaxID=1817773 RepID=A0A1F6GRV7_9PROT|nr:MAG: hypothetical protein A2426_07930 [Candidatus Lambdaproteobacteria bacterium RIFOXYC1_FULL_56_13]OGH00810.1 MAG: hypothetical protein A2557_03810 [Candidatus Lambdaproteobacteria bacterium RIFOXYD2_FULL_56_26]OGH09925.1 MAG: hypothetical protein A2600_05075 [Candidatus Lambdaproteobacteria bacterium RIFOXYD1_FULL_56_27]